MSDEFEDEERQLRIALMKTDIEHKLLQIKMENRKFAVQFVGAIAAAVLAGVAIGRFILFHQ